MDMKDYYRMLHEAVERNAREKAKGDPSKKDESGKAQADSRY